MSPDDGSAMIAFDRMGSGEPLVLLHGLGSNREIWRPVTDRLAREREVVAVDLPGFGDSPTLPSGTEPSPAALAAAVAGLLDRLGIDRAHVAGNSLGGWVAVELARAGRARSLTLLSPAGLWRDGAPLLARVSLAGTRGIARGLNPLVPLLLRGRVGRTLMLGHLLARPWRMPAADAVASARSFASCPGFAATLDAMRGKRLTAAPPGTGEAAVPMTVAFGARDRLLLRGARFGDALPDGVDITTLPGCGHVPTYDDPDQVAAVILATTREAPATA